ncbi:hypothetical protein NE659_28605, partial [Flavonifractor plautii]|uniref:hypothetical protein n=1 Tax=Flavonifractor plautii TaxID=292800 RepID=UPI00210B3FB4
MLADFSHARACKPFCENSLTLPHRPEGRIFRAVNIQIDLALQIPKSLPVKTSGFFIPPISAPKICGNKKS